MNNFKTLTTKLKSSILILALGIFLAAGVTFAGWVGTSNMTTGSTIVASDIKDNFDYLYGQLWQKNGSDVYYNTGNVGVGTTEPSNKLEVVGKIEADEYCDRSGTNCKTVSQMGGGAIRVVSSSATAANGVARSVSCNSSEIVTGGGGSCSSPRSSAMKRSFPYGNGWYALCNTAYYSQTITVTVYAICMAK